MQQQQQQLHAGAMPERQYNREDDSVGGTAQQAGGTAWQRLLTGPSNLELGGGKGGGGGGGHASGATNGVNSNGHGGGGFGFAVSGDVDGDGDSPYEWADEVAAAIGGVYRQRQTTPRPPASPQQQQQAPQQQQQQVHPPHQQQARSPLANGGPMTLASPTAGAVRGSTMPDWVADAREHLLRTRSGVPVVPFGSAGAPRLVEPRSAAIAMAAAGENASLQMPPVNGSAPAAAAPGGPGGGQMMEAAQLSWQQMYVEQQMRHCHQPDPPNQTLTQQPSLFHSDGNGNGCNDTVGAQK